MRHADGIADDVTRPGSSDQTELFSQERWVDVPFTAAQVREDAVRTYEVSGTATAPTAPRTATTASGRTGTLPATGGTWALAALAALTGGALLARRGRAD